MLVSSLMSPWPWYVAGPLIGLFVPLLLLVGNRMFGISSNFRHLCAALLPHRMEFFHYDWRRVGGWNLAFALGILLGGFVAQQWLTDGSAVALSADAAATLRALGVPIGAGLVPAELFSWHALASWRGIVMIVVGGFLVGFGTAYAGGCTSGHAISGLADLQLPSLVAVIGFFAGGLLTTWFILPALLAS